MPNSNENSSGHPTLRAMLDHAIESGQTTRKALGIAAEADDEMVRRWLNGQFPKLKKFQRLLASDMLPDPLRDSLAAWFHRPTPYRAIRSTELDATVLDADGDQIVGARDVMVHSAQAVTHGTRALEALVGAMASGKLNEAEKAQVRSLLHESKSRLERAVEALDYDSRMRVAR